jgi:hypothetical protein
MAPLAQLSPPEKIAARAREVNGRRLAPLAVVSHLRHRESTEV